MPSKPAKTTKTVKSAAKPATARKPRAAASRKVSSKAAAALASQHSRYKFLTIAILTAAALLAIAMGLNSQDKLRQNESVASLPAAMFIGSEGNQSIKRGEKLIVKLYANSGSEPVNAVQGSITYPADKLKFSSINTGADFPKEAATDTATPGLIRIARSVDAAGQSQQGLKTVAAIEFDVMPTATGAATFTLDKNASLIVRTADNKNVLFQAPPTTYQIK